MEKQINVGINDGEVFFAHETSVNYNPMQFVLDFRCVTPRTDPRTKNAPYIAIKHNVVLLDLYHAKQLVALLSNMVNKFEKEHGKIEKPKHVKKMEKKMKTSKSQKIETKTESPSYFG